MLEWAEMWWTSITGPKNLCEDVVRSLRDKSCVCLVVPDDLPWRSEMRACVENGMHQHPDMESFFVEFIDVADDCPDAVDIGRYLLERFANPDVAAGYRRRSKIQQYILDNHVLDNRVLWIKGMTTAQEINWLQFCKDYAAGREQDGRFVLEARWTHNETERRNLAVIRYDEMVNRNDLALFNSIYLNDEKRSYSPVWQQYAATLCSLLCKTDAETSRALMERCDFTQEEPYTGIHKVAEDSEYIRRGESNPEHVLNCFRTGTDAKIKTQIWKAQLQILFPLLEIERVNFIECYRDQIQEAIQTKYCDYRTGYSQRIYQYGGPIENPDEVELGTIYRMMKLKCDSDTSQYLLYIPNENSRLRLDLLHELRNSLAHGKACSVTKVAEFANSHPFTWL